MSKTQENKKYLRGKWRKTWIDTHGYETFWLENTCERVHRAIFEDSIGRKLLRTEHVHHINGDCLDNRLSNLQLLTISEHGKISGKESKGVLRPNQSRISILKPCEICSKLFKTYPSWKDRPTCSRKCSVEYRYRTGTYKRDISMVK